RKQTMAEAVEQLERMDYVERRPNPRDRRSRLVFLTARGTAVKPVTHATAARVERRWAELTSKKELEALRASLLHLLTELGRSREVRRLPAGAGRSRRGGGRWPLRRRASTTVQRMLSVWPSE